MSMASRFSVFLSAVIAIVLISSGCATDGQYSLPAPEIPLPKAATPEEMAWFQDAKFGFFIHWSPVSLRGAELSWSRKGPRPGREPATSGIPVEEYDNLYKQFNPTKFNADEWVAIAQAAGMKYLVFTSKHHAGFNMFDTQWSDYSIMHSPFKRDICAELADACHKADMKLGWYYSPPDWHHPDYMNEKTHDRYITYLHRQMRELCTRYGKVDIIWFDGLGNAAHTWDALTMIDEIRTLQPGVLINDRAGYHCDYDTPEQRVGEFQLDRPWETCMTIGTSWGYKPNDQIKSLQECVSILVRTVGGGGNLLFNVGPMPTGEIEPCQVQRLKEIGNWLKTAGEAIYSTRGGPFRPMPWGATTSKDNKVYIHILCWPTDQLELPAMEAKIKCATLLNGQNADVKQSDEGIQISVLPQNRTDLDTIVVLELDRPADEAGVAPYRSGSLAIGHPTRTKSGRWDSKGDDAGKRAMDDDFSTAWVGKGAGKDTWIEVDLETDQIISRATLCEPGVARVKKFALQCKKNDGWQTLVDGSSIGDVLTVDFAPVKARYVRLTILESAGSPTISELQLFGPKP